MAMLKKNNTDGPPQWIELKNSLVVIGRDPTSDVVLGLNGVSRRHAEIHRYNQGYAVMDPGSRNRTYLNGSLLEHNTQYPLRHNDQINICDVEFTFVDPAAKLTNSSSPGGVIVTEESGDTTLASIDASRFGSTVTAVKPEAKLKAILEISKHLASDLNLDSLSAKILDVLFSIFPQAERAFLVLKDASDPKGDRLIRKAFKYRQVNRRPIGSSLQKDEEPMSLSKTIVKQVLEQKLAVISQNAGDLPTAMSIVEMKIQSVMCVPILSSEGDALGILQLDTSGVRQFSKDDLDLLLAVASQASIAIVNAAMHLNLLHGESVRKDLETAKRVQKAFLPQTLPKIPGYEFFAYYDSAFEVGGDFYDIVPLPRAGKSLAVALGDVSGKGIAAALMMAKFSSDNRLFLITEDSPAAAACRLNDLFCETGIDEKFITLSLSFIDPVHHKVRFACAGHAPLLIRRADGTLEEIGEEISRMPIGILPGLDYQTTEVEIEPGDIVVVYSDGMTDARNSKGEIYHTKNHERLFNKVRELGGTPESLGRGLLQDIREFVAGAPQADDMTLVCFGRVVR